MKKPEKIRIKLWDQKMVAGIMSSKFYNSYTKYDWVGTADPATWPTCRLMRLARSLGYAFGQPYLDGGREPHTWVFTKYTPQEK